ncbi:hypothetical protein PS627_03862 [Pseudomonas fluorescens]|nr:hypothetical protein PS627_03862 [Pseudomonas fluorescens]
MGLHVVAEPDRVERDILFDDMQRTARAQCAEEHRMAQVSRQGRDHRHAGRAFQWQGVQYPLQVVAQRAMADGHALGLAGGAGGVDHIGQLARVDVPLRAVFGAFGTLLIEQQRGHAGRHRQAVQQGLLGQQHADATVFDHVRQALGGKLGIERHVGAAGLPDGQQADHHVQRAMRCQADTDVRPDTQFRQTQRQPVGPRLQLAQAQGLSRMDQRQCLG